MDKIAFGAIEQKKKESDFELGAISSPEPIPESYMTPEIGYREHQHKIPCCGANAGAYVKDIQEGERKTPEYLWKVIKTMDGFKPEDGTSMEAIFKALQKRGVCDWNLMPNDSTVSLKEYTDPSTITKDMDINALEARIGAYAFTWNPTMEDIKRAVYEHKAVIMLLSIGQEWWTPSWKEKDILPLHGKTTPTSGHFVVAVGYDKDYIYFLNGWGDTWGRGGMGYFGEDYMPRVRQIGTCFDYVDKAPYIFTRTLKYGMRGTDVGVLQQILKDKGFFPKDQKITGNFLGKTLFAVEEFQRVNGLKVDGIVGKMTQKALTM